MAADKGELYTAASPRLQHRQLRTGDPLVLCQSDLTKKVVIPALASRGATSRPNGEPIATVIICSVA